jgi:hypothetical protein
MRCADAMAAHRLCQQPANHLTAGANTLKQIQFFLPIYQNGSGVLHWRRRHQGR